MSVIRKPQSRSGFMKVAVEAAANGKVQRGAKNGAGTGHTFHLRVQTRLGSNFLSKFFRVKCITDLSHISEVYGLSWGQQHLVTASVVLQILIKPCSTAVARFLGRNHQRNHHITRDGDTTRI